MQRNWDFSTSEIMQKISRFVKVLMLVIEVILGIFNCNRYHLFILQYKTGQKLHPRQRQYCSSPERKMASET